MSDFKEFIALIQKQFPEDRITWQRGIATFHPEYAEETASLFRLAGENKQKLFIAGFGNNIIPAGDAFGNTLAVKSDRLNCVISICPEDLYITVGAGYPIQEINKILEPHSLFLPHADLPYAGSVGGALAVGLSLLRNNDPHPVRLNRFFLKAEIVTPDGEIIRPGSVCFKSVSGFDIVKIFSPSWGLLGMIMSAVFRVLPLSAREEYRNPIQQPIDYNSFAALYSNPENNQSAIYSIKIKNKFDPAGILPPVSQR